MCVTDWQRRHHFHNLLFKKAVSAQYVFYTFAHKCLIYVWRDSEQNLQERTICFAACLPVGNNSTIAGLIFTKSHTRVLAKFADT
jgi:hypothetical protein